MIRKKSLKSQIIELKPIDSEAQIDKLINLLTERNSHIDCYLDKWICSIIDKSSLVEYYKKRNSTLKHIEPDSDAMSYLAELLVKYDPVNNAHKVDTIYDEFTSSGHCLSQRDFDFADRYIIKGKGKKQWKKRYVEGIEIKLKVEIVDSNKIVYVSQPLASLLVTGSVKQIKIDNYYKLHKGDTIFVFANAYSTEMVNRIKYDSNIWTNLCNGLFTGSYQDETFPENCYIGKFVIGNKVSKGVEEIVKPTVFNSTLKYQSIAPLHPHAPCCRFEMAPIEMSGRTIIVPVDDEIWSQIEELKGDAFFYWEEGFNKIVRFKSFEEYIGEIDDVEDSENCNNPLLEGVAGDEQGLYDILFKNRRKQKLFKQMNERAVRAGSYLSDEGCYFKILIFDFEKITEVKEEESSFEILQKKEWILDWKCVRFKNGIMIVYSPLDGSVKFKPKGVPLPGVIEAYNYLTDYLNDRLAPVHCFVEKMELTIYDTIRLNEAIQKFATASKQKGISVANNKTSNGIIVPQQMSFNQALSKAKLMTAAEFEKYKSEYIDYLVKQQSKKYKVIPCVERLAHTDSDITEYAFMFSIECKSKDILIVYENVHPDRSTLLFVVKPENYDQAIRSIYDFMQSAEINKRSSLRDGNIEIKQTGVERFCSINHDGVFIWSRMIKNYKLFYANGRVYMVY